MGNVGLKDVSCRGGWRIGSLIKKKSFQGETRGDCSICYEAVNDDGRAGVLKAIDYGNFVFGKDDPLDYELLKLEVTAPLVLLCAAPHIPALK